MLRLYEQQTIGVKMKAFLLILSLLSFSFKSYSGALIYLGGTEIENKYSPLPQVVLGLGAVTAVVGGVLIFTDGIGSGALTILLDEDAGNALKLETAKLSLEPAILEAIRVQALEKVGALGDELQSVESMMVHFSQEEVLEVFENNPHNHTDLEIKQAIELLK
jgi:hypothetical protein